ncbi:MAG: glycosyltransferase, partial [Clostridia bacterium]
MSLYAAAVVPAYNEETRVGTVLQEVLNSGLFETVVAVDDGSTDDTFNEILAHPVVPIRHPENRGKGAALQSGL